MGVIVVSLSSCKGKQSDATETLPAENGMVLTAQDTTITRGLVTTFMDRIVAGDKGAASQLLYTVDFDDENGEPYPMTEQQLAEMDDMLSLPVTGYEIADCVFDTPESNEIRCRTSASRTQPRVTVPSRPNLPPRWPAELPARSPRPVQPSNSLLYTWPPASGQPSWLTPDTGGLFYDFL